MHPELGEHNHLGWILTCAISSHCCSVYDSTALQIKSNYKQEKEEAMQIPLSELKSPITILNSAHFCYPAEYIILVTFVVVPNLQSSVLSYGRGVQNNRS
jgi:hypothetical protein